MIAEVAIPISFAASDHFDYEVPKNLQPRLSVGCRVLVPLRASNLLGYCLRLKPKSSLKFKCRPILKNFDETPLLDEALLDLANFISSEYFCSLAEAIQTIMPPGLRNAKKTLADEDAAAVLPVFPLPLSETEEDILNRALPQEKIILLHDLSLMRRWTVYAALIKKTLHEKKSVLFLTPDHRKIQPVLQKLQIGVEPLIWTSHLSPNKSARFWRAAKQSEQIFVAGTRSAVFLPLRNLGLIIIDEEEHFAYRQDNVPYYETKAIALRKSHASGAKIIFGSATPSLESWSAVQKNAFAYVRLDRLTPFANIQILDTRNESRRRTTAHIISKNLEYRIASCLEKNETVLLFSSRKGFSTYLVCRKCGAVATCPRCSASLSYFFKEKAVVCPTCQYRAASFDICPTCKSSYVRYAGFGAEKIESEILRLFPSAKIASPGAANSVQPHDIMIATPEFLETPNGNSTTYDNVCILDADRMLSYPDFRATEQAFTRFLKLLLLAKNNLFIQTAMAGYYAVNFLQKLDIAGFLNEEIKKREELDLPPAVKMAAVTVRAKKNETAKNAAEDIYRKLKKGLKKYKDILDILEPAPLVPLKKRGNYHYQTLVKYRDLGAARKNLFSLLAHKHGSAIVTIDPSR